MPVHIRVTLFTKDILAHLHRWNDLLVYQIRYLNFRTLANLNIQVGPSSSNNAQGKSTSAPALAVLPPRLKLFSFVLVNPGATAFTLIPSPLNSCANEMVYELTADLLVLYATTWKPAPGRAWTVLLIVATFTMTPFLDLRKRGRKAMVVWTRPKKLVSIASRMVEREIEVAFWFSSSLPIADDSNQHPTHYKER